MLDRETYSDKLDSEMNTWADLMQSAWGEVPILEPKVEEALKVSINFDLGDFPHKGQTFFVTLDKAEKLTPEKVAKKIVQEINSHRNFCNRCGVPTPHISFRQRGFGVYENKNGINWRTQQRWTEEELAAYDIPPDELERKLHPRYSRQLDTRLERKRVKETEGE